MDWNTMLGSATDFPEELPFQPDVTPPSILDCERNPPMDMQLPLSDPCPMCGGFRMLVGDWACYGACSVCVDEAEKAGVL